MDRKVAFAARSVVVVVPARRTRVTDAAVRSVVAQLGEDASVRSVREALGGGSLRDVSAALKRAKDAPSQRARQELAADVPEEAALVRALQRLEDFYLEQGAAQEARLADFSEQLEDLQRALDRLDPSAFLHRLRVDLKASLRPATVPPAAYASPAPPPAPALPPDLARRLDGLELALRQRNTEVPEALRSLENRVRELATVLSEPPAPPATAALPPELAQRLDGLELALRQRNTEVPETLQSLENQVRDLALVLSEPPAPAPPPAASLPDALLARLEQLEQSLAQPDPHIPASLAAVEARLESLASALAARPAAPRVDLAAVRRDLRRLVQAAHTASPNDEHLITLANNQASLAEALRSLSIHLTGAIATRTQSVRKKPAAAAKPASRRGASAKAKPRLAPASPATRTKPAIASDRTTTRRRPAVAVTYKPRPSASPATRKAASKPAPTRAKPTPAKRKRLPAATPKAKSKAAASRQPKRVAQAAPRVKPVPGVRSKPLTRRIASASRKPSSKRRS